MKKAEVKVIIMIREDAHGVKRSKDFFSLALFEALKNFSDEINNLIEILISSGNSRYKKLADKAKLLRLSQKNGSISLYELLHSLDYLRVSVKYVLFDLEATKRENTYLKRLLNERENEG